ncbi:MAG: HYExAFE family protein [Phycisphaeraceae bacterium]|nr:HYExAFE family protein [Phycisphaeraceae bacterium]MCW5763736.1 HYExAFE family protein [Phycisphaeraceae bacterium]
MAQRRHQYERAFEAYLRARKIPYVAVNEAKKAILPDGTPFRVAGDNGTQTLKSFDFVVYGSTTNLLVEIKGRRLGATPSRAGTSARLESWVTLDDVESLKLWQQFFGFGFEAALVFVYQCELQPPDGLFQEVFEHAGKWFMLRAIYLNAYVEHMRTRSPRWRTVHLSASDFERCSQPFGPSLVGAGSDAGPEVPAFEPLSV